MKLITLPCVMLLLLVLTGANFMLFSKNTQNFSVITPTPGNIYVFQARSSDIFGTGIITTAHTRKYDPISQVLDIQIAPNTLLPNIQFWIVILNPDGTQSVWLNDSVR